MCVYLCGCVWPYVSVCGCVGCCGLCLPVCVCVCLCVVVWAFEGCVCVCVWLCGCVWMARLAWNVWDEDPTVAVLSNVLFETSM